MKNLPFLNRDVLSYEPRTVAPDIVSRWPPTEVSEGLHEPPKAAQLPAMRSLATQVERMRLDVEMLAPVHGQPVPWSEFASALRTLGGPRASSP